MTSLSWKLFAYVNQNSLRFYPVVSQPPSFYVVTMSVLLYGFICWGQYRKKRFKRFHSQLQGYCTKHKSYTKVDINLKWKCPGSILCCLLFCSEKYKEQLWVCTIATYSNSRPVMIRIVVQPFKKLFIHKRVIMRCVVKWVKFLQCCNTDNICWNKMLKCIFNAFSTMKNSDTVWKYWILFLV